MRECPSIKRIGEVQNECLGVIRKDLNNLALAYQLVGKIRSRLDPEHIWSILDLRMILVNSITELDQIALGKSTVGEVQNKYHGVIRKDLNNLALAYQLADKIRSRLDPEHIWGLPDLRMILVNSIKELDQMTLVKSINLP